MANPLVHECHRVDKVWILNAKALDPISYEAENLPEGATRRGRLTVTCYGRAWACYWGSMASSVDRFIVRNHASYVVECLMSGAPVTNRKARALEAAYLERIVTAIQDSIKQRDPTCSSS